MNRLAAATGLAPQESAAAYRALCAHDARFDGHWFVGVTSTRIYCRPVCRVKTPVRANCRFFRNAALAEAEGFRPCLRCRPELAPGLALVDSAEVLALHAARRLTRAAREGECLSMPALAAELGVTDRHLRRIFRSAHGVSPLDYLGTQRLLQAKQLLTDTDWPIAEVATASGFSSLRRFHAAFAARYRLQPTRWREGARPTGSPARSASGELRLRLAFRPPYDRAGVLHFLQRRAVPGLEDMHSLDGGGLRWCRSLAVQHEGRTLAGWIGVELPADQAWLMATLSDGLAPALGKVAQRLREAFDLDADPAAIDAALAGLPVQPPAGLRMVGSVDGFEAAVRVVLGQQVSTAAARTLTARLVRAMGEPLTPSCGGVQWLFPTPRALHEASVDRFLAVGLVRQRALAIQALARLVLDDEQALRPGAPVEAVRRRLLDLPGIGPWTVELIVQRALGWPDAFPAHDLGVLQALGPPEGRCSPATALARAEAWRPWRSYAMAGLWRGLDPPAEPARPRPIVPPPTPTDAAAHAQTAPDRSPAAHASPGHAARPDAAGRHGTGPGRRLVRRAAPPPR